jgi:hypothetical protein
MTAKPRARVLVLGAYPVAQPRHGGQVRLAQLARAYRRAGFDVRQASCFPDQPGYLELGLWPGDIPLHHRALQQWQGQGGPFLESAAAGDAAAAHESVLERLEHHAGRLQVLHLEQPWLLPVVRALRRRGKLGNFSLVYGSQNIEYRMLQPLWQAHAPKHEPSWTAALQAIEQVCAQEADLVAAVTDSDREILKGWARPNTPVLLAPNGIQPWAASAEAVQVLSRRLKALWDTPQVPAYALYVASDHPPNVNGFAECFGASLACLPPGHRVVVAGRAGPAIEAGAWFLRQAGVNRSRLHATGPVGEAELSAWRELAGAYLLCVTGGGGSNLKTAEALYSGRRVVATEVALRGFEHLLPWPNLVVAEPGATFASAVLQALQAEPAPPQPDPRREQLTWDHTLAALAQAARSLARQP